VANGAIEVYQLQLRLLYFHFGLNIRQEAAIALRHLAEWGLEVLYQSQEFPDEIHCHFRQVTIAASLRWVLFLPIKSFNLAKQSS
jgi:predicted RNA-binding protein associated with RNAse of E/G family